MQIHQPKCRSYCMIWQTSCGLFAVQTNDFNRLKVNYLIISYIFFSNCVSLFSNFVNFFFSYFVSFSKDFAYLVKMIDCIGFCAVSTIFQSYNGGISNFVLFLIFKSDSTMQLVHTSYTTSIILRMLFL